MPAPDQYPINAAELAHKLRVNPKSLRALIRLHNLVPGHVEHKEYRIDRVGDLARSQRPEAAKAVGRDFSARKVRGLPVQNAKILAARY